MPNKDNNDIINDILNEIDKKKNTPPPESAPVQREKNPAADNPVRKSPEVDRTASVSAQKAPSHEAVSDNNPAHQSDVRIRKAPVNKNAQSDAKSDELHRSNNSKNNKKKKKKKKRSRLPGVLILTTFIFAVSISLSLVIIAYGKEMLGIGKSETTHLIVVPEGATTEEIAEMLVEDKIIKSPEFFKLFSRLRKADAAYIAGEHFVRPNMAYETIINELTSVESTQNESVEVTFPEGITLIDAAYILEENHVCSADDFLFYFNAGGLGFNFENRLNLNSNLKFYRMEGFLFPDTYYFYVDMEPEQVCQKIYLNFDNKMTEERYKRMEELNLNLDQLITFASIVQREAATTDSMTMVASVFWNRLNNPDQFPLLQSDPTTNYAENVIKPHMEVYDQVMIDAYDTYKGTGLPPGPICNPGIEAIDAVLAAVESDYFYFYANINTGITYFAATLEEHNANIEMVDQQIADAEAASAAAAQEAENAQN